MGVRIRELFDLGLPLGSITWTSTADVADFDFRFMAMRMKMRCE